MLNGISKSDFNAGLQCQKRLFLTRHHPELAATQLPTANRRMQDGIEVGKTGRGYYPGGKLIESGGGSPEATTADEIKRGATCLYEAAFQHKESGLVARCDVLRQIPEQPDTWHMVEVKSGMKPKPEYVTDVAFQVFCVRACGVNVVKTSILHINNQYSHSGAGYDPLLLFTEVDVTLQVEAIMVSIQSSIAEFQSMLGGTEPPNIETNRHCAEPPCEFNDHCHKEQPRHDVIHLPLIRSEQVTQFRRAGYGTIDSLPEVDVKPHWKRIWSVVKSGQAFFDPGMKAQLSSLVYPLHFIDFESVASALPVYAATRPYQQVTFQWSNHIVDAPNYSPRHEEYLCRHGDDPRPEFAESLWNSVHQAGTLVVYSSFEAARLRDIANDGIPCGQELSTKLESCVFDLLKCVKDHVYHVDFNGSFSVKKVLPALVPELSYASLPIHDGDTASLRFLEMQGFRPADQAPSQIAEQLLDYCQLDTLAMVKIFDVLCRAC